ncbi:MAG: hypothetical protein DRO67_01985 [Candidatus Asgardarchaeum californiense]|nr:MAG: hypothetical protein DRO67_01985 [Candidatus Asgardarchaeum californiense]
MKYKYPKKITIGDTKFKIIYDYNDDSGASFSYPSDGQKAFIRFGMKNHKEHPEQFLNHLLHELKEIVQVEQSTRMWKRGADGYEFHYSHSEHTDLCCRLSSLLRKFIK